MKNTSICAIGAALTIAGQASVASAKQEGFGSCPAGYEYVHVDDVPPIYALARFFDEVGNNDGFVCRRPLGDGIYHKVDGRPDTIYHWRDNDRP